VGHLQKFNRAKFLVIGQVVSILWRGWLKFCPSPLTWTWTWTWTWPKEISIF